MSLNQKLASLFPLYLDDDSQRAASEGRLGDLNPTPWAFMLFNCIGWVTYSILIHNYFVFFGNVFALCLSVWLNMIALELQYADCQSTEIRRSIVVALQTSSSSREIDTATPEEKDISNPLDLAKIVWDVAALNTKAPVAHKTIIMFLTIVWTLLICIISLGLSFPASTKQLIVGVAVNLNLVFFYGAPLSTIFVVLRTSSCSTIHVASTNTMFFNGLFWGIFGFAVQDWFIAIPNLLGALLGALLICLYIVYPRVNDVDKSIADRSADPYQSQPLVLRDTDDVERPKDTDENVGDGSKLLEAPEGTVDEVALAHTK
jgi:solute carrier family 50 protein (sugar transporter)